MNTKLQAVINYIISSVDEITPKKLQKLLYYVQAWHLVFTANNEADIPKSLLFDASFEAWIHGPVIPIVHEIYHSYHIIHDSGFDIDYTEELTNSEITSIDAVIQAYGNLNGNELESLSTNELPWKEARKNLSSIQSSTNVISYKTIFDYYQTQL